MAIADHPPGMCTGNSFTLAGRAATLHAMSDDADRVPLRVVANTELGEVSVDLTEYSRP